MAQAHPYHQFFNSLAAKTVNVNSDTFKMSLHTSSYVPNLATHQFQSSLTNELSSGSGYTTGGAVLSGMTTGLVTTNDVQTITPPTSGTFTVTITVGVNTQTSSAIAFNASAATVQADLVAMPNIGAGNVTVALTTGKFVVTFGGSLGAQFISTISVSAGSVVHTTSGQGTWNITGGNAVWTGSTLTAHYGVVYDSTPGSSSTNPLVALVDFVTDQSTTSSTFTNTWDATGIVVVQIA